MRLQIHEHREEFKKRIDEIALEMINQAKKCEANIFERTKRASFFLRLRHLMRQNLS